MSVKSIKITFISTVYNESKSIKKFLKSLDNQKRLPDEVIIVDAASTDGTADIIRMYPFKRIKNVKVLIKKGNRSVGRNEAIKHARYQIIACSDSGNILDALWLKHITEPFKNNGIDVVSGFYQGKANTVFQQAVIPFALVMPDKVKSNDFLPATRSIAFTKKIWEQAGKFNESLSHNEDFAFAHALKKHNAIMYFEKKAIVYWLPRNSIREAYIMFLRFAYGDAEARLYRPKVVVLFIRYLLAVILAMSAIITVTPEFFALLLLGVVFYSYWAMAKNYRYVNGAKAGAYLLLLQYTSDIAVMHGTIFGILGIWDIRKTQ